MPAVEQPGGVVRGAHFDPLLPVVIGVIGAAEVVSGDHDPLWLALGSYGLAAAVLCVRRSAPLAMPLLVAAVYALTPALGFDVSELASWLVLLAFACFSAGLYVSRRRRWAGLGSTLSALAITLAGIGWLTDFAPNLVFGLIVSVGSWALGAALQEALARTRRLAVEAERARIEAALAPARAADSERRRIASELHDALAHALGVMVVRATVARDHLDRDPGAAAGELRDVTQMGRDALGETGSLLGLVRDDRNELGLGLQAGTASVDALRGRTPPIAGAASTLRDLPLPALFAAGATTEMVAAGTRPLGLSVAVYWLAAAVLCGRRALPLVMPIAVTVIALGGARLGADTDEPASWILLYALACLAPGLYLPLSRTAAGAASVVAAVALMGVDTAVRDEVSWDAVFMLVFAVAPWATGVALRQAFERCRQLARAAEHARAERELEAERAAAGERRRIARELHDVLAKSLSVMVVQASLAAELAAEDRRAAGAAVDEVQQSGRAALRELGRLLRLIGDKGPGRCPQPGLADLAALADDYRRAGLALQLIVDDAAGRLPVGVELSTYRIVQEGLTNILKYAPGSPVRIALRRHGPELAIEVRNGRARSPAVAAVSGGHGLVGLRERVAMLGGEIAAQPTADGGFVLAATIPVEADAR